ncbi:hypothetical protein AruPA_09240 [Acidiphilium sp. PA]|uniref:hypothetical protein n=1 Tax=Acidiphilium sp. PA TaxID=2871705 RepID=UPI002244E1D7|nr:hypothetical protein [Acidiphilium sp. PA]MCW8307217.1 hypothetical protein [Acidiphilium sp. PA]
MNPVSAATALVVAALGMGLSGCSQFEPFQRQGTWHANRAPMQNIEIELANPRDFYRGSSHPVLTGNMATTAIDSATSALSSGSSGSSTGSAQSGSGGSAGASSSAAGGSSGSAGMGSGSMGSGGMGGGSSGGGSMGGMSGGATQ